MKKSKAFRVIALVFIFLSLSLLLSGCSGGDPQHTVMDFNENEVYLYCSASEPIALYATIEFTDNNGATFSVERHHYEKLKSDQECILSIKDFSETLNQAGKTAKFTNVKIERHIPWITYCILGMAILGTIYYCIWLYTPKKKKKHKEKAKHSSS